MADDIARPTGIAVDASGGPVVDPTANVLQVVQAAVTRLDDLREASAFHAREMAQLRADFGEKLRAAETERIDAIRKVDVDAVQRAAEVQQTQAQALAAQVAQSAETLRTQVAATAEQGNVRLAATLEPILKDIADLRRAQYEAQGQKTQVVETRGSAEDLRPLLEAIGRLERAQSENAGAKQNVVDSQARSGLSAVQIGLVVAIVSVASVTVLGIVSIAVALLV